MRPDNKETLLRLSAAIELRRTANVLPLYAVCICVLFLAGCGASRSTADKQHGSLTANLPDAPSTRRSTETNIKNAAKAADERKRLNAAENVIETAKSQMGVPYRYGGTSPSTGFDCSGFARWVFAQHGITLPRTSREQMLAGIPIDKADVKPGDLLIFSRRVGSLRSTHAGIYVGDGNFIHSPRAGQSIRVDQAFEDHYAKRFICARRVILNADEVKVYARQEQKRKQFIASGAMHTVKSGQTLSGIAMKYGVTVRSLVEANNIKRSSILRIGQKLHIPTPAGAEQNAVAALDERKTSAPVASGREYEVRQGDTVSVIAHRHHVSTAALLQANNLPRRHVLRVGQKLVIPTKETKTAAAKETATATPPQSAGKTIQPVAAKAVQATENKAVQTASAGGVHVVASGDTVWSISRRHGVSKNALLESNGLTEKSVLQIGQKLRVPGSTLKNTQETKKAVQTAASSPTRVYSVKSGDTIWSLARKNGISTKTLLEANNLNDASVLNLGQKLRIPVATAN